MEKKFLALALIISVMFSSSCMTQKKAVGGVESSISQVGDIERIRVTSDQANITSGCTGSSPVVHTPSKDTTFDVESKVADWFAVKLPNNQIGFIPQNQCKPIVVEDKRPDMPPTISGGAPQGATVPKTPDTTTNSNTLTSQEQEMLKLVNAARSQNNLPPLSIDIQLANVSRIKSQDMIDNNYFSHNSPKYGSPFDMMKSFGIKFIHAGENIAGNQSVQSAHNALMNSPGHRKNILSPDYTHIGIGIRKGGQYGNMFTQMFVSKPK